MGYHPRIEAPDKVNFLTTRTLHSRLWFINNRRLESSILGHAARCAERYKVQLYALAIEGNHIQGPALFPKCNRASFMRDLNSAVARAVPREAPHPGGRFWSRRYSNEFLPGAEDVEEYFFYTVLQPVNDGLVEKISDYPGYNCFHDAVWGCKRKFTVVRWGEYNMARKRGIEVNVSDFTETVFLQYARLPGYEELTRREYALLMLRKLEERRVAIVRDRYALGLGFLGREKLLQIASGSLPKNSKTSSATTHRPRVLSICPKRRAECKAWYFDTYFQYQVASLEYRSGSPNVLFPPGTYPPHLPCRAGPDA